MPHAPVGAKKGVNVINNKKYLKIPIEGATETASDSIMKECGQLHKT
jgi:hypothetical protein